MSKCEWKELNLDDNKDEWEVDLTVNSMTIRYREKKPEELIIKRSGETFVARYDGIDYINIMNKKYRESIDHMKSDKYSFPMTIKGGQWEKIEGLEITDEIAKLRPMINLDKEDVAILVYVKDLLCYSIYGSAMYCKPIESITLATVEDLED